MSEVIEKESAELVTLPSYENALHLFTSEEALDHLYHDVEAQVIGVVYDMSTRKGREQCASDAYKVARSKAAVEKLGAKLSAEYKEIPKKIDASRRHIKDRFDALQGRIRQPLNEWEEAEKRRIEGHLSAIEWFKFRATECRDTGSNELRTSIGEVESRVVDDSFEEFEPDAHRAKSRALEALRAHLAVCEQREAEQAELARLRAEAQAREQKEREERIAREAEERVKREAEAKAQAEREAAIRREQEARAAAERRELELKLAAEKAEREKIEAQQRAEQAERDAKARAEAAAAAERKRQADEAERIAAEQRKREADKAHKAKVNRAALQAFIKGGLPEDCAKQAVTLVAKGEIPDITINY